MVRSTHRARHRRISAHRSLRFEPHAPQQCSPRRMPRTMA